MKRKSNVISIKDKLEQVGCKLKNSISVIKFFSKIKLKAEVTENIWNYENSSAITQVKNNLMLKIRIYNNFS